MKHYRIKENREDGNKQYIIQHHSNLMLGLYFWKKLNDTIYTKYDEAINGVKEVIDKDDYEDGNTVYHYIDAYKLLRNKKVKVKRTGEVNKS